MKTARTMLAALAAAIAAIGAPTATAASPVQVDFAKHVVDPAALTFAGTTSGDAPGTLTSELVSLDAQTGPILHITFRWTVSSPGRSFTAVTSGIWNTNSGSVVMNGRVTDGYLEGAQVHEAGQLVDLNTLSFEGSLRLMPSTAN
jgi:hypothetical protein